MEKTQKSTTLQTVRAWCSSLTFCVYDSPFCHGTPFCRLLLVCSSSRTWWNCRLRLPPQGMWRDTVQTCYQEILRRLGFCLTGIGKHVSSGTVYYHHGSISIFSSIIKPCDWLMYTDTMNKFLSKPSYLQLSLWCIFFTFYAYGVYTSDLLH